MCFTPTISLATAVIEFAIATFILIAFRKSMVNIFFVALVYILGLYQFTEFMLCLSNNPVLWAKLGFVAYSFLPAIAIYFIGLMSSKKQRKKLLALVYLIPVAFSVIALSIGNFIIEAKCSQFFVLGKNMLYSISPLLSGVYSVYYAFAIFLSMILIINKVFKEEDQLKKKIYITIFIGIVISLIPAIVLILVIPSLNPMFPSVYCEFAVLLAIAALIGAMLDSKLKK